MIRQKTFRGYFMDGFNNDLLTQMEKLEEIILSNKVIYDVLLKAETLKLQNYYIGAGCIAQTIWNSQMGLKLLRNCK